MSNNFKPTYSAYNVIKNIAGALPGNNKPSSPYVQIYNTPIGSQKPSFVSGSNNGAPIYTPTYSDAMRASSPTGTDNAKIGPVVFDTVTTPTYRDAIGETVSNWFGGVKDSVKSFVDSILPKREDKSSATPEATLPVSYEEYVQGMKETNAANREQAINYAEAMRERGLVDARSAYEQSRSSYGSNAQEFSRAGLQGSGYSQYLDSKAYTQMRDDQQSVNANADKAIETARYNEQVANNEADGLYASYLEEKESAQKNMFANLFDNIENLTTSDISTLGSMYGLSEEQIKTLTDKRQNVSYQSLLDGGYDKSTLDTMLSSGDITQTRYDELLKGLQNPSGIITSESFVGSDGNLISRDDAQDTINQLKDNGVSEDVVNSAQETFDAIYNIKTNDVTYRKDGGKDRAGEAGNNFSVESGDTTFYVQYSGEEVSNDVKNAALSLTDGTVFMYHGKVYMKLDGEVYGVEKRSNSYAKSWKKLKEHLGG